MHTKAISYELCPNDTIVAHLHPKSVPCISWQLLEDLSNVPIILKEYNPTHLIFRSDHPKVFNLGGDLKLFRESISEKDTKRLREYGYGCVRAVYNLLTSWDHPVITICDVDGQCLGGGFEGALACDYIIGSENATFGFPESSFNLFPGMGAITLLTPIVGEREAIRMCAQGWSGSSRDAMEKSLIQYSVAENRRQATIDILVAEHQSKWNTYSALRKVKAINAWYMYDKLYEIVDIWVEAAMNLPKDNLDYIGKLSRAQRLMK